jgi:Leucine-rich repeat (LRR) protein
LDLRNNKITEIKQFKVLKQLQHLYLGFNNLSKWEDDKDSTQKSIFNTSKIEDDDFSKNLFEIRDIKYIPPKNTSQFLIKELKTKTNPIDYFAESSWMLVTNNKEFEIFKLNESGKIMWIQKRRNRIFSNQI